MTSRNGKKISLTQMLENPDEFNDVLKFDQGKTKGPQTLGPEICSECEEQRATVFCGQCNDPFCDACCKTFHKKGARKNHTFQPTQPEIKPKEVKKKEEMVKEDDDNSSPSSSSSSPPSTSKDNPFNKANAKIAATSGSTSSSSLLSSFVPSSTYTFSSVYALKIRYSWVERAKYIPVRLQAAQRKKMRLIDSTLSCSQYTNQVDLPLQVLSSLSPARRLYHFLQALCGILTGLAVSTSFDEGQELIKTREFSKYPEFFRNIFEVGRRYKITSPEKMRGSYGKMIYMLMDLQIPQVRDMLSLNVISPIQTVYSFLESHGCVEMLMDEQLNTATREIFAEGHTRDEVQDEIRRKEKAIDDLAWRYSGSGKKEDDDDDDDDTRSSSHNLSSRYGTGYYGHMWGWGKDRDREREKERRRQQKRHPGSSAKEEELKWMIYSLNDNMSFLRTTALPCHRMLLFLEKYFSLKKGEEGGEKGEKRKEKEKEAEKGGGGGGEEEGSGGGGGGGIGKEKENQNRNGGDDDGGGDDDDDGTTKKGPIEGPSFTSSPSTPVPTPSSSGLFSGRRNNNNGNNANVGGGKERDKYNDLSISFGVGGARLQHPHNKQYRYVEQTLILWREILNDFFHLWYLAEADLLDENNRYELKDTGQGLNRVQPCPRIAREMGKILQSVQLSLKDGWIGSSVIHLGDTNTPNALVFIDKYTQVSRILSPVVHVLDKIERVCKEDNGINTYVTGTYGSVDECRKEILQDFFKYAFDGSGSDNFFEAGSCIDGRLTSAWNWCSKLEKKRFNHIFLLCGFTGFDGQF